MSTTHMLTLEEYINQLAQPIAHEHKCSLDEAKRWVEVHVVAEAREAYRQVGAPFGESDTGFVVWLLEPPL